MDLIEALRAKQGGMSQAEFARRLGVSESSLSYVYAGKRRIGEDMARQIGKVFPDLFWLATGYIMSKGEPCPDYKGDGDVA